MCKPMLNAHVKGRFSQLEGEPMNKQPEVTEATRAALVEAFCSFYRERPVERITVKEVAEKAGYSRATYYKYFTDNYDLLDYVEESLVDNALSRLEGIAPRSADWAESFVASFANVVETTRAYSAIFAGPMGTARFTARAKREVVPQIMRAFGISEDDRRALAALEFHTAGLIAVLGYWLGGNWDVPAEEVATLVRGILNDGVLAQLM